MFESIINFFKKIGKTENEQVKSKDAAKERLHLVLMQDRANVSADFLDLMKQEIIEVIKKYIEVDENSIDVRLTNKTNGDGTTGAPALYANIPIVSIKDEAKTEKQEENKQENNKDNDNVTKEHNGEFVKEQEENQKEEKQEENKEVENKLEENIQEENKQVEKQNNEKNREKRGKKRRNNRKR